MSAVAVREATLADINAIQALGLVTWPQTYLPFTSANFVLDNLNRWWSEEAVRRTIERDQSWVSVDEHGSVVGTSTLGTFRDQTVLWKLYVHPSYQGQGVGRTLLDVAIKQLRGGDDLILEFVGGNDIAWQFYRRMGFVVEREERNNDGTSTVWCRLKSALMTHD